MAFFTPSSKMDDFHENAIKFMKELKIDRDVYKSDSTSQVFAPTLYRSPNKKFIDAGRVVFLQQNEFLKTKEALQLALSNSRSQQKEYTASENAWKTELETLKQQFKQQEAIYLENERKLTEENQSLDEKCKEEHFAAVRAQAEYAASSQKSQTDHSSQQARAQAEITRYVVIINIIS